MLKALRTYAEFKDQHNLGICLRTLARLWQANADATIPGAVAEVLGAEPEEVERLFGQSEPEQEAG